MLLIMEALEEGTITKETMVPRLRHRGRVWEARRST